MHRDSTAPGSEGNLDLLGILRVLRQRAPLIAMCVSLTGAAAFALSKAQTKQYTATSQILFRDAELDEQAAGLQVVNQSNPQSQTDTNLKLATLPRVAAETAAQLGHGLTQDDVANAVTVTQETDTDLADVAATWTSPAFAARIANTYAQNVDRRPPAIGRELLHERSRSGQPSVQCTYSGPAQRRRGGRPEGSGELATDPQPASVG